MNLIDVARRPSMAARAHKYIKKADFHPGGKPGKLHRELGISVAEPIGASRIAAATHSKNPEIRRDAVRAQTMAGWNHGAHKTAADRRYAGHK